MLPVTVGREAPGLPMYKLLLPLIVLSATCQEKGRGALHIHEGVSVPGVVQVHARSTPVVLSYS